MREFGSEFEGISLPDNYFINQCRLFKNYEYTRSGREAIRLVAISIKEEYDKKKLVVLLPSYICPSMVSPFEHKSWDIYYYKLNGDLSINELDLITKIKLYKPACVLLTNYFGNLPDNTIAGLIKDINPEINIVYDFTHSLLSLPKLNDLHVDYYVASLRKWFGLADGGLVLTDRFIKTDVITNDNSEFVNLRSMSLELKNIYLINKDRNLKTIIKSNNRLAETLLNSEQIYRISEPSLRKLHSLNISEIKHKRNINFLHLWDEIKDIHGIRIATSLNNQQLADYTFMLPLLFEKRDEIQTFFSERGLYAQVIWKIQGDARQCLNSIAISDHILCIPIDQRYNFCDINDMAKIIKSAK